MECKKEENIKGCPCTYPGCERKGKCCECLEHHLAKKELPACCFSKQVEKTYNRSFEKFVQEQKIS